MIEAAGGQELLSAGRVENYRGLLRLKMEAAAGWGAEGRYTRCSMPDWSVFERARRKKRPQDNTRSVPRKKRVKRHPATGRLSKITIEQLSPE